MVPKIRPYKINYVFAFLNFFHTLFYVSSSSICFNHGFNSNFSTYFLTTEYLLTAILLLYLGIKNKSERMVASKDWVLSTSLTIVICWLPLFVCYNLIDAFHSVRDVEIVLWYLAFLPEYLAYSCSMITVWRLWKSNQQFKVAFRKFFRRNVPSAEYEELFMSENTIAK
ncbi:unnamed protein product [Phaedon cochleariae]|uniref:Uncharacterized protein n=1 Tax=Phaedon cochleariae TaxID=80249 RepID=A0A9N9SFA3_PHACE|nr:unnamed protein product [Phaedon cochleariae]